MYRGLLAWNIILTILLIAIAVVGYFQMDKIVLKDELNPLRDGIDRNVEAIQEVEALAADIKSTIVGGQDEQTLKLIDELQEEIDEVELIAESNRSNIFSLSVTMREVVDDIEQLKK